MLSEVIFECRSLFPAPTVPRASGRAAPKPEVGLGFSEQVHMWYKPVCLSDCKAEHFMLYYLYVFVVY
jgi:hypothetical protein